MIRRSPLPRCTKPVRKTNPKRRQSEFSRSYHSRERVRWVKSLPCVFCGKHWPSDNAHTVTGGMGRKADYTTIIPLCPVHHRRYDLHQAPFADEGTRCGMQGMAAEVERLWLEYSADTRATA